MVLPLVGDLGAAFGFTSNRVWKLVSLDYPKDPNRGFVGQFEPQGLTENVGARLPETQVTGQQIPVIQWSSGDTETFSFRARIYRTSPIAGAAFDALSNPVGTAFNALDGNAGPLIANSSVKDQIERVKSLSRVVPELGRPERFTFLVGTEMAYTVFVRSPGGIQYDPPRSDGTIRGATFDMQLIKINPLNLTDGGGVSTAAKIKAAVGIITTVAGGVSALSSKKLIDIPGGSLHTVGRVVTAKQGDTMEKIAAREYGNALLGEVLRRAQPDKADPLPGQDILTIVRNEALQIAITPQSIALRDTAQNKELFRGYLTLRGKPSAVIP